MGVQIHEVGIHVPPTQNILHAHDVLGGVQDPSALPEEIRPYIKDGFWDRNLLSSQLPQPEECPKCDQTFTTWPSLINEVFTVRHNRGGFLRPPKCPYETLGFICGIDWTPISKITPGTAHATRVVDFSLAKDRVYHTAKREGVPCRCGIYLASTFDAAYHFFRTKAIVNTGLCQYEPPQTPPHVMTLYHGETLALMPLPDGAIPLLVETISHHRVTPVNADTLVDVDTTLVYPCRHSGHKRHCSELEVANVVAQHHSIFGIGQQPVTRIGHANVAGVGVPFLPFQHGMSSLLEPTDDKAPLGLEASGQSMQGKWEPLDRCMAFSSEVMATLVSQPAGQRVLLAVEDSFTCCAPLLAWYV